ncbi:MAG TPA: tail fiber domain-containing protein [Thermomicrobiales bacterium]|nr:tail fiber domain-containing protein [Thermomicrobiales bacterium]
MDGRRFDAIARTIVTAQSRRDLARLAAAAALAGAVAGARDAAAGPACMPDGKRCRPHKTSCELCCANCNVKKRKRGRRRFICGPQANPCASDRDCCPGFSCEGEVCTPLPPSDRALKTCLAAVDPEAVLAQVAILPIATWSYTFDDPAIRHVGPMAQDFAAAFGVGVDDRTIHPLDGQGVALAAIQALHGMATALRAENAALCARLDALERRDNGD